VLGPGETTDMYARQRRGNALGPAKALSVMALGAMSLWRPAWVGSGGEWLCVESLHLANILFGDGWQLRAVSSYFALCEHIVKVMILGLTRH